MLQTSRLAAVAIALQAAAVLAPTATLAQAVAPARCPQGQVWREAFPDDYLCVTPQVRAKARAHAESQRTWLCAVCEIDGAAGFIEGSVDVR